MKDFIEWTFDHESAWVTLPAFMFVGFLIIAFIVVCIALMVSGIFWPLVLIVAAWSGWLWAKYQEERK